MAACVTAKYETRLSRCAEHGLDFPQIWVKEHPIQNSGWRGHCERCAEDERLSLWADNELQKPEESAQLARQLVSVEGTPEYKAKLSAMKAARLDELVSEYRQMIEPSTAREAAETLRAETLCELEYQRKLSLIADRRERR